MNERLLKAITALSKQRSLTNRKAMYMAVLRASFFVPTKVCEDGTGAMVFAQDIPLQGRPVYAAFTSLDTLKVWRPDDDAHDQIRGMDLVERLISGPTASLLINPKNPTGGELYRNELEMLAEAAPRLRAWLNGEDVEGS